MHNVILEQILPLTHPDSVPLKEVGIRENILELCGMRHEKRLPPWQIHAICHRSEELRQPFWGKRFGADELNAISWARGRVLLRENQSAKHNFLMSRVNRLLIELLGTELCQLRKVPDRKPIVKKIAGMKINTT